MGVIAPLWDAKALLLIILSVYAFLRSTRAFRPYDDCLILAGCHLSAASGGIPERLARIATSSGRHFNRGIRACYFGPGALTAMGFVRR